MESFLSWLPTYDNLTWKLLALYVVAGVFGALVRVAWLDKPLRGLFRDGKGALHLGFYGEIILGIAVAILIDGHPIRAGLGAVFAPSILSAIQEGIVYTITRKAQKNDDDNA